MVVFWFLYPHPTPPAHHEVPSQKMINKNIVSVNEAMHDGCESLITYPHLRSNVFIRTNYLIISYCLYTHTHTYIYIYIYIWFHASCQWTNLPMISSGFFSFVGVKQAVGLSLSYFANGTEHSEQTDVLHVFKCVVIKYQCCLILTTTSTIAKRR